MCETRIENQMLPPCNDDFGFLLKNINFSAIKTKITVYFGENEKDLPKLYPQKLTKSL